VVFARRLGFPFSVDPRVQRFRAHPTANSYLRVVVLRFFSRNKGDGQLVPEAEMAFGLDGPHLRGQLTPPSLEIFPIRVADVSFHRMRKSFLNKYVMRWPAELLTLSGFTRNVISLNQRCSVLIWESIQTSAC